MKARFRLLLRQFRSWRRNTNPAVRSSLRAMAALGFIILCGTIGYSIIEGVTPFDALYFTIITLTTTGYGEMQGLSDAGRAFTMVLILTGIGVFSFALGSILQQFVGGYLINALGVRRMHSEIARLRDHFIICGYGRLGRTIADHLERARRPYVVIDLCHEKCEALLSRHTPAIEGDASEDRILKMAGIEAARGILIATPEDPINVYITLTARTLNHKIPIIARAIDERAEEKLQRAGATRVVSPLDRGAVFMTQAALHPSVVDFIDIASSPGVEQIQIEQFLVPPNSPAAGKSLRQLDLTRSCGVLIVAIRRSSRTSRENPLEFNPRADAVIEDGDTLVVMGEMDSLTKLEGTVIRGGQRRAETPSP